MFSKLALAVLLMPLVAFAAGCAVSPVPLDDAHLLKLTTSNLERVTAGQEEIRGSLSLYEAVGRALKYNLDDQVELMKVALAHDEVGLATAQLLPTLAASAGYSSRNNDLLTSALDTPTGVAIPPRTLQQERTFNSGDVGTTWHILDFALSYVRAQQAADRQLIAVEARRKVAQRIIEDTRAAYWRAVSCDRMTDKLAHLEKRVKKAIAGTRTAAAAGAESPITGLTYERELVQIHQLAERLQHELTLAKSQLASLMNVPPGTPLSFIGVIDRPDPPIWNLSAGEMVAEAIFNRPEIRDVAYQQRITEREATAALLDALPGIKLTGTASFSDDRFLLNNNWLDWGAAAAGSLVKIAQLPARRAAIENQVKVLDQKALAITMLVMTQVYVSRIRYQHLGDLQATAKEYLDVQKKLVDQLRAEKAADLVGEQTLIREEMNLLVAEVQYDIATGNLDTASSNMMTTLGFDLQGPALDTSLDVKSLTAHLRKTWGSRTAVSDRGRYLLELETARQEALRKQAEEEQRRKQEAQRIADEAARIRAEEVRVAREQARIAEDEARKARDASARQAQSEARQAKAEARAAALEAATVKAEHLRVIKEKARIAEEEDRKIRDASARQAKADKQRLQQEAAAARETARQLRRGIKVKANSEPEPAPPAGGWKWVWPFEGAQPKQEGGLKDEVPRKKRASGSWAPQKQETIYSGTK